MTPALQALVERLLRGDRRGLARAITLIESRRPDHREQSGQLLERLLPRTGHAVRLGLSGSLGAGKSTFIETLGQMVIEQGHRIAVLGLDVESARAGGSIPGDKAAMQRLAASHDALVRPSPPGDSLRGVARRTREAALACEATGFDVIVIETVDIREAEQAVADMVDTFLLLLDPGSGVAPGSRPGLVELADLVAITKADGALLPAADAAKASCQAALDLLRPGRAAWRPQALTCSALEGDGIAEVWDTVLRHRERLEEAGELSAERAAQMRRWLWAEVQEVLVESMRADPATGELLEALEAAAAEGRLLPPQGARELVERFRLCQ